MSTLVLFCGMSNLSEITVNGFSMIHQFKWDPSIFWGYCIRKTARVPIFPRQPHPNGEAVGIMRN